MSRVRIPCPAPSSDAPDRASMAATILGWLGNAVARRHFSPRVRMPARLKSSSTPLRAALRPSYHRLVRLCSAPARPSTWISLASPEPLGCSAPRGQMFRSAWVSSASTQRRFSKAGPSASSRFPRLHRQSRPNGCTRRRTSWRSLSRMVCRRAVQERRMARRTQRPSSSRPPAVHGVPPDGRATDEQCS